MRLWSLHPKYLDGVGLVALWRETLLAKKVLAGKTRGYKNHPQLSRFKSSPQPRIAINTYLLSVYQEAEKRGYHFDLKKVGRVDIKAKLLITSGQLEYEFKHLLAKLKTRDFNKYQVVKLVQKVEAHPLFRVKRGEVASWEKVRQP